MLIIRRSEKSEAIVDLLQSYFEKSATSVGLIERKESALLYHSGLPEVFFNVISTFKEPHNALNVLALCESAKMREEPFLWIMHESGIHLAQQLRLQGMEKRGTLTGFYYDLEGKLPLYESHPATDVVQVETLEQFYEWVHVFSQCYDMPVQTVEAYFKAGFGQDRVFQLFLVQVYQKSIACSAMYVENSKALLLWDSVLPMYRRQGIGQMMVINRMVAAQKMSCKDLYSFGLESSLLMLKSLSFRSFGRFTIMRYDEPLNKEEDG